jgi:hypothetical protein
MGATEIRTIVEVERLTPDQRHDAFFEQRHDALGIDEDEPMSRRPATSSCSNGPLRPAHPRGSRPAAT